MSDIRVTYSGLVSFVLGLAGIFTGLIFTLVVTRTLTVIEYGTWNLIYGLIFYVIIFEPVFSYWATRNIARGVDAGKTAVLSSGLFSIGGIFAYIIISYFVGQQTNINQNYILFAAILIPLIFLNRTLSAINMGWKPHAVSYGTFAFGVSQIPLALIFIYLLNMGVYGVILTIVFAYLVSIAVLSIYAKTKIKNTFKKELLTKWLKLFWLPLYPAISSILYWSDLVIFSVIVGSVIGVAFWSAAMVISSLIAHSALISRAVYPKLLGSNNIEYIKENLTQLFYFAIPLTALAITFARPALFALNPEYEIATSVVIFTSIFVFLNTLSTVFHSFLTGIEKVDINEKSTFKDYIKSKLFFLPTLLLVQNGVYVSLLAVGLLILTNIVSSQLELVIYWSILALVTQIPFTVYHYALVKRNFVSPFDYVVFKYLLVSIGTFGLVYIITEQFLDYKNNVFEFLPDLLLFVGLAIVSYLAITYLIDFRTKKLFKSIIEEIRSKF